MLCRMPSWPEIRRDELAEMFPDFDVWFVPRYCARTTWCARPKGHPIATMNADDSDDLQAKLAQALAEKNASDLAAEIDARTTADVRAQIIPIDPTRWTP